MPWASADPQSLPCAVTINISIVLNLALKPVPDTDFTLTRADGKFATFRTDDNGKALLSLAPGRYHLSSKAIPYLTSVFTWSKDFDVPAAATASLAFTQADATVSGNSGAPAATTPAAPTPPSSAALTPHQIYMTIGPSVVAVQCDLGSGSGFLVDRKNGLFITNAHVVRGTHQVAVRFDRGIRYPAQLVISSPDDDVAVIRVNPAVLTDAMQELQFRDLITDPVSEGDSVIAIGWPLHQDRIITQGIVSRVEKDIVMSDVNINHGNSGGPLLDTSGQVVGITTFLDTAQNGPGISGILKITTAIPILAKAKVKIADGSLAEVPSYQMPDVRTVPIPTDEIETAESQDLKPCTINEPANFTTEIVTPFVLASLQNAQQRDEQKGKAKRDGSDTSGAPVSQFWNSYVGENEPVILFIIEPQLKETSGSHSRAFFGSVLGALSGTNTQSQHSFAYRDDFYDMQLWRGNQIVLPISSNRIAMNAAVSGQTVKATDEADAGLYSYDPSVFAPGLPLVIKMRSQSNLTKWNDVPIAAKDQSAIWDQFAGYRAVNPDAAIPQVAPASAQTSN